MGCRILKPFKHTTSVVSYTKVRALWEAVRSGILEWEYLADTGEAENFELPDTFV